MARYAPGAPFLAAHFAREVGLLTSEKTLAAKNAGSVRTFHKSPNRFVIEITTRCDACPCAQTPQRTSWPRR